MKKDPMGRFLCLIIFSREANLWVRSFKERVKKKNLFCFLIIDAERKCEALLPQRYNYRQLSRPETIFRKIEGATVIIIGLLLFSGRVLGRKNILAHRNFLIAFLITEIFGAQTINY